MDEKEKFSQMVSVLAEPNRAKILWILLDGRSYTATELANLVDNSTTSTSNHLGKLLNAKILKMEKQGRHRYFSFYSPEIAYAIESLGRLISPHEEKKELNKVHKAGIYYCRTCYDHLAGFIGVSITQGLEKTNVLCKSGDGYLVSTFGREWFREFGIIPEEWDGKRRLLTRQCLDWTERKPHLAGLLGALLLENMVSRKWFRKIEGSRELMLSPKGRKEISEIFKLDL